ncbi:hypothetical protein Dimus_010464, partial [Dionaea muscipula]
ILRADRELLLGPGPFAAGPEPMNCLTRPNDDVHWSSSCSASSLRVSRFAIGDATRHARASYSPCMGLLAWRRVARRPHSSHGGKSCPPWEMIYCSLKPAREMIHCPLKPADRQARCSPGKMTPLLARGRRSLLAP